MRIFSPSGFSDECETGAVAQLDALVKLGIGATELRSLDGKNVGVLTESEVKAFAKEAAARGIGFSAVGSPLGKINLADDRRAHFETAKRLFEFAALLGTDRVRIFSFYLPKGQTREDCFGETVTALGELLALAKPYGITLCHENEAGIFGESPEDCDKLLRALPELSCVFDMGNFTLSGYDPLAAYELLRERICYFHIKDGTRTGQIVPPGCGDANVEEILRRYKKEVGKPTYATLEPHLCDFVGLAGLTSEKHDTPFRFDTPADAFAFAAKNFKNILERVEQ